MKNSDLKLILDMAEIYPRLLPHILMIYRIGKAEGILQEKIAEKKLIEQKLLEVL